MKIALEKLVIFEERIKVTINDSGYVRLDERLQAAKEICFMLIGDAASNWKGIIHHELLLPDKTINLDFNYQSLMKFKQELEKKRPELINVEASSILVQRSSADAVKGGAREPGVSGDRLFKYVS
ncbi:hypothetical protein EVAR_65596_1 [Eumeta japonica]|uniref:Uncharacterized protein n=1 Tax=Eumeta variegata TaxID=151549 RepID=A0A4C2A2P9_EUMVA|nr:hypothetical protein EVAR_65596_1 [Eumeta japonica]